MMRSQHLPHTNNISLLELCKHDDGLRVGRNMSFN